MKQVGLLAGMSWISGLEYERRINLEVNRRLGGVASANLLIRSFDFSQIEALQAAGEWEQLGNLLLAEAKVLQSAGCDAIAICTNTMHSVAPLLTSELSVPLLHIGDAIGQRLAADRCNRVAVLGTKFTMEQDFLKARIAEASGASVIAPAPSQQDELHRVIYEELVRGQFLDSSRQFILDVIADLGAAGCDGVVAACTEIEELLKPEQATDLGVSYFPSGAIHASFIADYLLQ